MESGNPPTETLEEPLDLNTVLEELAAEGQPHAPSSKEPWVRGPGHAIAKVRYSHDAMIDLIVANPAVSQNELAATFGYTPPWVSLVMSSDAFKARLEQRREELVDPVIRASLNERFNALVTKSLEVLQTKLSMPVSQVSDNLALRAAELGAKALGLGGNAPPAPQAYPEDRLAKLAERLVMLRGNAVNGEIVYEVPEA